MEWFEQTNLKIYFCEISKAKSCERPNKYLDQFILQFLHFIFVDLHVTWVCLQSLFECSCKSKKCTYPITQNSLWVSRSGPYRASLLWWVHSVGSELYLCSFLDYYCLQLGFVSRLLKVVLTSMIKHKSIEIFFKNHQVLISWNSYRIDIAFLILSIIFAIQFTIVLILDQFFHDILAKI